MTLTKFCPVFGAVSEFSRERRKFTSALARLGLVAAASGGAFALNACGPDETETVKLTTLRVGVLPDQSAEHLRRIYDPLFAHVERETGLGYQIVAPGSYAELVALFQAGQIDFAHFGGLTFLRAHQTAGAVPLIMRDVDAKFTSYFLVRADDPAKGITEFEGRRLSFGSDLSTSGHLMPRYFLGEFDIAPERFFGAVAYSGSHDKTAYDIRDERADIGVANSHVIDAMFADGRLKSDEVRVLWESPPYADYVWALRNGVDQAQQQALLDAFLSLSTAESADLRILENLGAGGFLPASLSDFRQLSTIAADHGLLPDEG